MALKHKVTKKPIVIKLGPLSYFSKLEDERQKDLSYKDLENIVDTCISSKVDGIVTTNTSQEHIGIHT